MDKLRQAAAAALEALENLDGTEFQEQTKAIKALRAALAEQPAEQVDLSWVDLQNRADEIVRGKSLWKRFIDGTPLANDIACWMADFAQEVQSPQPAKTAEQEPEGNVCGRCGGLVFDPVIPQPRREVELTDEEITHMAAQSLLYEENPPQGFDAAVREFARAVIEAYKAKQEKT